MADLSISIGKLHLKNPVLTASGTFGYGKEFLDFYDIGKLGAFITKGTTLYPREGNPYPRMAETKCGMLNAVGLQNRGIEYFLSHIYPEIEGLGTYVIPNLSGGSVEEYVQCVEKVEGVPSIQAIELNVSCPNVKQGGMAFGTSKDALGEVVREVRKVCTKTLIVKLSPNVTHIQEMAQVAEEEGADALSLINTILGMSIDVEKRIPLLSTITGGLSGPCVKPIALRMVWQVAKAVHIPIIGMGGIMDWSDAVEFLLAGASAVEIGTANFVNPLIPIQVIEGINDYMDRHNLSSLQELIGSMKE